MKVSVEAKSTTAIPVMKEKQSKVELGVLDGGVFERG